MFRKLLAKPIWWWERKSMGIHRRRWNRLFPIRSDSKKMPVVLLATPAGFEDAIWSAWSWLAFMGDHVGVRLYVDGELPLKQQLVWDRMFPGSEIHGSIRKMAAGTALEQINEFIQIHPLGAKLMLLLILQNEISFIYSDSDIILFRPAEEIIEFIKGATHNRYLQEEGQGVFDHWLKEKFKKQNLPYASTLNSGLFFIQKETLDMELAIDLLRDWSKQNKSWFTEQSVMSAIMAKSGAAPLPCDRYVISNRRQFYFEPDVDYKQIVIRHFTGTTRHVLYHRALPHIFPISRSI